jgi:hypothetical protein
MKTPWKSAAIITWILICAISVGAWMTFSSPKLLWNVLHNSPRLPEWARTCVLMRLFEISNHSPDDNLKLLVYEHSLSMAFLHVNEVENRLSEMAPAAPSRKLLVLRASCRIAANDNKKAHSLLLEAKAIPMGDQNLAVLDRNGFGVTDVEIDAMIRRTEN